MYDAIAISDMHLGSKNCQAEKLAQFLDSIRRAALPARRLILNGDVFDSADARRLERPHRTILSLLHELTGRIEIICINGNHDGPAGIVSDALGVAAVDERVIESGGRKILFLHGHRFDEFIARYPYITWAADRLYNALQRIDRSHQVARLAKRNSKTFLRCAAKIEQDSVRYAAKLGCHAVCCGHTHQAVARASGPVQYFNSGCWTEKPCHFLTVKDGTIEVCVYNGHVPVPARQHI